MNCSRSPRTTRLLTIGQVGLLFAIIMVMTACSKNSCCYRITKSNLEGSWKVNLFTNNGVAQETGNSSFRFEKDGTFENSGTTGQWEFGETNDVLLITTEDDNYNLSIHEFSEQEMIFSRTQENIGNLEYHLTRE